MTRGIVRNLQKSTKLFSKAIATTGHFLLVMSCPASMGNESSSPLCCWGFLSVIAFVTNDNWYKLSGAWTDLDDEHDDRWGVKAPAHQGHDGGFIRPKQVGHLQTKTFNIWEFYPKNLIIPMRKRKHVLHLHVCSIMLLDYIKKVLISVL